MVTIGTYPTTVERLEALCEPSCELWVKRDDHCALPYGGNKVRKLERLLDAALAKGAKRIVTFGAVGSHHVLATTIYGRQNGLRVAAVLTPQPASDHAVDNIRAALHAGLEPFAAHRLYEVPAVFASILRKGDYVVPPGGSNVTASLGYVDAAAELRAQVQACEMPDPDIIVVALGSGGTAAGILAGVVGLGMRARVVAVRVVDPPLVTRASVLALASAASRTRFGKLSLRALSRALELDGRFLGRGYGYSTAWGERAQLAEHGLKLDPTYTAKAFAGALDHLRSKRHGVVLYWHTLSAAPMQPLLEGALSREQLPAPLLRLLV